MLKISTAICKGLWKKRSHHKNDRIRPKLTLSSAHDNSLQLRLKWELSGVFPIQKKMIAVSLIYFFHFQFVWAFKLLSASQLLCNQDQKQLLKKRKWSEATRASYYIKLCLKSDPMKEVTERTGSEMTRELIETVVIFTFIQKNQTSSDVRVLNKTSFHLSPEQIYFHVLPWCCLHILGAFSSVFHPFSREVGPGNIKGEWSISSVGCEDGETFLCHENEAQLIKT